MAGTAPGAGASPSGTVVLAQATVPPQAPPPTAMRAIGKVESVDGAVRSAAAGPAILRPGSPVHEGEVIETGPDGRILIRFEDGTTLATGPGARIVLDELVYDPSAGKASFVLSVLKGTFLYVTGLIAGTSPEGVEVRTPAGTIGIRGTAFGCVVDSGTVCVLLEDPDGKVGRIEFRNAAGQRTIDSVYETVAARDALSPPSYARLGAGEVRDLLLPGLERSSPIEPTGGPGQDQRTGGGADFATLGEGVGGTVAALGGIGPQDPTALPDEASGDGPDAGPLTTAPRLELAAARDLTIQQPVLAAAAYDFGSTVALPPLADGTDLFAGAAFAQLGLAVFGDARALTVEQRLPYVDLTVSAFGAAFRSTLGACVVGADGRIGPPTLVAADVGAVAAGTAFRVDPTGEGLRAGETLGLFLLADGFRLNPELAAGGTVQLAFRELVPGGLVPGAADVGDAGLELVLLGGRRAIPLAGELWHTLAHVGGLPLGGGTVVTRGLNRDDPGPELPPAPDGGAISQHHLLGLAGADRLRLAFEDSPLALGDRDYQDVVVELTLPPAVSVAASAGPFRFGFAFASRTGELEGLTVRLVDPDAGARLGLGPELALDGSGRVLIAGQPSGLLLAEQGDDLLRFATDRPVAAEVFARLADGLALAGDTGALAPGSYTVLLEAREPGGDLATLPVRFLVPEAPLVGSAETDDLILGGRGNDVLFGLGGADRLEGGRGSDLLVGGPGRDILVGGAGADLVRLGVVTALDRAGSGEPDGADLFLDFRARDGDLIDLAPLLAETGFDPARAEQFLRLVRDEAGRAVEIQIDPTGTAGAGGWASALTVAGTLDVGLVASRLLLDA